MMAVRFFAITSLEGEKMLLHDNSQFADTNSSFVANLTLPESEKRLHLLEHQKLIQTSLDGFWVASTKDARILEVNDVFCKMVGYSREELLTMYISDLEADESPAETAAHIRKVMDIGHDRFETRHRHKQGHLINLEVGVSHSELDNGVFFVFVRDITERKRTEDVLYFVAQRGWMGGAENFFDALAQYLGETLGVDYVVIDRLDRTPGVAETVALYAKGAIAPNLRYDLKGTPCENVIGRKFCFYPQDIQQLFPNDTLLVEMGAESYAGIPLWDSSGQPIGLIALMDSKPLADEAAIFRLLQLVSIRAAAELERERSDRMLRERERKFRTLAENMPDTLIRYDREGRRTYINPALKRISAVREEQMIGLTQQESNPFIMPENYRLALEHTLATGERSELELPIPTPSGDIRTNLIFIVPERAEDEQISGAITIGHDITERKQLELDVAAREQEFRSLAESSLDSIIRYDLDGRIRYLNRGLLNFFGLSASDVIGKLPGEVWPDGRYAEIDWAIALALETGKPTTVEFGGADAAGKLIFNQVHVIPERDVAEQIIGAIGYGRDVTAIREAERQLKHFITNLPGMAYTFRLSPDGHGSFPFISPSVEKFYGLKPEDVRDDIAPLHNFWHPDDRTHIEAATAESARTMMPFRIEGRVCRPGQSECWLEARALPEREADGSIIWFGIMLDITERKKMEQERINHLMRLEELSRSLVAAQEDARQRLARELHDRTSPNLAAIDINLNVIAAEIAQEASTDLTERMEDIRALISDTTASIREIGAEMHPPLLDYAGLIAAMESYALLFTRRTGIQVYFECENRDTRYTPQIESLLFRIFQEALTNCSKHSSAESIRISLCNGIHPNILTITDDGVGFDPEQLGKTRKIGLGLLNMREMAEVAGVKIAIASTIGKGTCITLAI
jgi:PAS domain S-box-containing protein